MEEYFLSGREVRVVRGEEIRVERGRGKILCREVVVGDQD